jgi:hypothetical protein
MNSHRMFSLLSILFILSGAASCTHFNSGSQGVAGESNPSIKTYKPGSEPDGFRGIRWEAELSTLEGMEHYRTDPSYGGIEFYFRKEDSSRIGWGWVDTIQYGFWREKFYVGMITVYGSWNFHALKEAVFAEFGEGSKPFHDKEEYLWIGDKAVMALQYDPAMRGGLYYVRSQSISDQIQGHVLSPVIIPCPSGQSEVIVK